MHTNNNNYLYTNCRVVLCRECDCDTGAFTNHSTNHFHTDNDIILFTCTIHVLVQRNLNCRGETMMSHMTSLLAFHVSLPESSSRMFTVVSPRPIITALSSESSLIKKSSSISYKESFVILKRRQRRSCHCHIPLHLPRYCNPHHLQKK